MEVKLLEHTKLSNAVIGARTCYDSFSKGGNYEIPTDDITEADKSLLNTLINVKKHSSISEHIIFVFNIKGISRLCYDDKTEVLTNNGFKLFKDLNTNDLLATRNKNGEVEFHKYKEYIEYNYNGIMHEYKNQVTDCVVTPNHRMMYKKVDVRINKDDIYYTKSEDIKINKIKFLKTMNFAHTSKLQDTFTIPFEPYYKNTNNGGKCLIKKDDITINKNDFLDFLAMYISDGCVNYNKKENKYIVYITKPLKKDLVRTIASKCGFKMFNANISLGFVSRHLGVYLKKLGKSYEKYIPLNVFDFSKEDAIRFLNTYSKFDGCKRKDSEVYTLCTTSKKLKEQLYILCLIAGYSPTVQVIDRIGKEIIIDKNKTKCNYLSYQISFSTRKHRNIETTINIKKHRKNIEYNGKVYCVSIQNGNLFVRRNNKGMWCGNCLTELARHRIASYSVKSSRYVLKKHLVNEESFLL